MHDYNRRRADGSSHLTKSDDGSKVPGFLAVILCYKIAAGTPILERRFYLVLFGPPNTRVRCTSETVNARDTGPSVSEPLPLFEEVGDRSLLASLNFGIITNFNIGLYSQC